MKIRTILSAAFITASLPYVSALGTSPAAGLQISGSASTGGVCSATLSDGRSFITGGTNGSAALAVAEFFESKGRVTKVQPMQTARTNHICVALADGTVLVAGGDTGK